MLELDDFSKTERSVSIVDHLTCIRYFVSFAQRSVISLEEVVDYRRTRNAVCRQIRDVEQIVPARYENKRYWSIVGKGKHEEVHIIRKA